MKKYSKILMFYSLFSGFRMLIGSSSTLILILKGFSEREVAFLRSTQFIITILTDIPLSYFSDKYSRKLSFSLGIFFSSFWLSITALSSSKLMLYIAEGFNAISLSFCSGSVIAYLVYFFKRDEKDKKLNYIFGRAAQYSSLAIIIAILISAFFDITSLSSLWLMAALLSALLFLSSIIFLPKDERGEHKFSKSLKLEILQDILIIKESLLNKRVFFVYLANILTTSAFVILINYNQIVTYTYLPAFNNLFFHSLVFILIIFMQMISGKIVSLFKVNYLLPSLALIINFLFISLFEYIYPPLSLLLFILFYFFSSLLSNITLSEYHKHINDEQRATIGSLSSTIYMSFSFFFMSFIGILYTSLSIIYMYALFIYSLIFIILIMHNYFKEKRN